MADQSDVETVLVGAVGAALYPQGTAAPSILGRVVRVYRGWPISAALDRDLAAGHVNVTVFPEAATQRNTTRWPDIYIPGEAVTPRLTMTVAGETASIGGTADIGQVAGLLVDDLAVVHRTAAGDTPESVAAVLGDYILTRRPALVSGATILVPGAGRLIGRVVADQPALRETRRQRQNFRVSVWCPDPETRDAAGSAVDAALSVRSFIGLADGSSGRVRFVSSQVFDQSQNAALYRRDLVYAVEYATTVSDVLPAMIFGNATLAPAGGDVVQSLLG